MFLLHKIDYFASQVNLTLNKESKISSALGGFLTLIIVGLGTAFIITTGEPLFRRVRPIVNRNEEYLSIADNYTLASEGFPFYFLMGDVDVSKLTDKSYISISINQYIRVLRQDNKTGVKSFTSSRPSLDWELCKDNPEYHFNKFNKFGNFTDKMISASMNKSGICLKNSEKNKQIVIGGEYTSGFLSNIYFEIQMCTNKTGQALICKPQSEISALLDDKNFQLYYIQSASNAENFSNPFYSMFLSYFIKLDSLSYNFVDYYFIPLIVSTDAGILFNEHSVLNRWKFKEVREQKPGLANGLILRLHINVGSYREIISRNYMKIQDLAALVGGILKVLLMIFQIVTEFFNSVNKHLKLFNLIYYMVDDDNEFYIDLNNLDVPNAVSSTEDKNNSEKLVKPHKNTRKTSSKILNNNFTTKIINDKEKHSNNELENTNKGLVRNNTKLFKFTFTNQENTKTIDKSLNDQPSNETPIKEELKKSMNKFNRTISLKSRNSNVIKKLTNLESKVSNDKNDQLEFPIFVIKNLSGYNEEIISQLKKPVFGYIDIILMNTCFCFKVYRNKKQLHNKIKKSVEVIADFKEVVDSVVDYKSKL